MKFYFNNELYPIETPIIRTSDRSFRFGDGVFETLRITGGKPYQWDFHMQRFKNGLQFLDIHTDTSEIKNRCLRLIRENSVKDGILRIHISRGSGSKGFLPYECHEPTIVIETLLVNPPPQLPVALFLSGYEKPSPKVYPTHFKTAQGLNNTLTRMEAQKHGCFDGLQLNAQGEVCETSSANIFFAHGDELVTPPLSCSVLPGSIRHFLLHNAPVKIREEILHIDHLGQMDGCIITNCNILAVAVSDLLPLGLRFPDSIAWAERMREWIITDMERLHD